VGSLFLSGSLPSPNAGNSRILLARTCGEIGRRSLLVQICSADEGLHRISDAKPITRNTKTPHAAVPAFPVDGRIFERQVRLLQLKMPLRVELVQRRVREQANRQCKLRVVRAGTRANTTCLLRTTCAAMENDCMNV